MANSTNSTSLIVKPDCAEKFKNFVFENTTLYCNWTFDKFLCWPPTIAGNIYEQKCPDIKEFDSSKNVFRKCSTEGKWESKLGSEQIHPLGWTNFTNCYRPEILKIIQQLGNKNERSMKIQIAERTRLLEIFGYSISLIALMISLVIFYRFRILKNNRTRIHRNLFFAMVIQVLIRLTLYLDGVISSGDIQSNQIIDTISIKKTPYVCEASYILLEYAKTAMFMWMFIEGLYLHNVVTVSVFQGRFPHITYVSIGWGVSALMTAIWASITAYFDTYRECWFGYNLTPFYWILEGPRLVVIIMNFIFLLNIIRVLIVKLRQSHTSEVEQVRKAVKAAVVLLPLLGITNMLSMLTAPLDGTVLQFAAWSYGTNFLNSFQGFFIAMIYCFLNGEVRAAIYKSISVYMSLRGHHDWADRRQSYFSANYPTAADTEQAMSPPQPQTVPINNHDINRENHQTKNHIRSSKGPSCYHNWISSIFTSSSKRTNQIKAEQTPETFV